MLAHFASLATQHQLKNKSNSNIVAKLAIHLSSAPIAVHQISHLLSHLVPFVRTRLPCGVRLATLQTSLRSAFANLVRKLHYLAPIAMLHTIRVCGVLVKILLALVQCTFALLASLVMFLPVKSCLQTTLHLPVLETLPCLLLTVRLLPSYFAASVTVTQVLFVSLVMKPQHRLFGNSSIVALSVFPTPLTQD